MNNKKYWQVYNILKKYNAISAKQISLVLKSLTSHQVASILTSFEKHGVIEKEYDNKAYCYVWKPKNLNSSSINDIIERMGENMTEEREPMVKFQGKFIPVSEYEEKVKVVARPVGKREQERWIPLLKFLSVKESPVPLKEIIAGVGPRIANSIYSLKDKGYIINIHRKYGITPKGEEYLKQLETKIGQEAKVEEIIPTKAPVPAPQVKLTTKPQVKTVKPAPAKKTEPEEIFEES